jgi:hypothetical protein
LILGLGLSIKNGLKGWANIYVGNEDHWNHVLWSITGPLMLIGIAGLSIWCWRRPVSPGSVAFPRASIIVWMVLVIQNAIAQLVTGPLTSWSEVAFTIYYLLLFAISAVIILHFQYVRNPPETTRAPRDSRSFGWT